MPAGFASVDERLAALADLVPGAIDAICLDETFHVVALPQALSTLGFSSKRWETNSTSRPLDVTHPEDRPLLMGLLARARAEGLASGALRFADLDEPCQLHAIDLVEVWGVYLFVRGGESARVTSVRQQPGSATTALAAP